MNLILFFSFVFAMLGSAFSAPTTPTTNYRLTTMGGIGPELEDQDRLLVLESVRGIPLDPAQSNILTPDISDQMVTTQTVRSDSSTWNSEPVRNEPEALQCLSPDGTFANWRDDTCRSYLVCRRSNPALMTCPYGEMFSPLEGVCVTRTLFSCDVTNRAMKEAADALSFLKETVETHLARRVKRSSDKTTGSTQEGHDIISIALPEAMCDLISWNTDFLETNLNNLIKVSAKCPKDTVCKLPTLSLRCDSLDDDEGENDGDDRDEKVDDTDDDGEDKESGGSDEY